MHKGNEYLDTDTNTDNRHMSAVWLKIIYKN